MNTFLIIAACLAFILGIIHSTLGELLIFKRLRSSGHVIPRDGGSILKERNIRILWASWHIVTIFGWGFGAILLILSSSLTKSEIQTTIELAILVSMLAASLLVLIGTKAKHPGWIVLLSISIFIWLQ